MSIALLAALHNLEKVSKQPERPMSYAECQLAMASMMEIAEDLRSRGGVQATVSFVWKGKDDQEQTVDYRT